MDAAEKIVTAIIADLSDRAGLDSIWDSLDETIKDEIYTAWSVKARAIVDEVQAVREHDMLMALKAIKAGN